MIHVVTGPPCAGKSTYAMENADVEDLIVDLDRIADALGAVEEHDAKGLILKAALDARESAIKAAMQQAEEESWIIHTSPSEDQRKMYEAAGAEFIDLDPGKDVCLERAKDCNRPQRTFEGIEKWYAGKKGRHMEHL